MKSKTFVIIFNISITWFMVGLIWLIQLVNYPLLMYVEDNFLFYHVNHINLISPLVSIVMFFELIVSILILVKCKFEIAKFLRISQFIFLIIIWMSTIFFQIPLHENLGLGFDKNNVEILVKTNWLRTFSWSIKGILSILILNNFLMRQKKN